MMPAVKCCTAITASGLLSISLIFASIGETWYFNHSVASCCVCCAIVVTCARELISPSCAGPCPMASAARLSAELLPALQKEAMGQGPAQEGLMSSLAQVTTMAQQTQQLATEWLKYHVSPIDAKIKEMLKSPEAVMAVQHFTAGIM